MDDIIKLNSDQIRKFLKDQNLEIEVFDEIGSTNDYLKNPDNIAVGPRIVLAEKQNSGRGRSGRPWHSPKSQNIHFSMAYPYNSEFLDEVAPITMVIGLAMVKILKEMGIKPGLKWPNDIIHDSKKLGGILVENYIIGSGPHNNSILIIGIGLNVNMEKGDGIDQPWTSLKNISGNNYDRNLIIAKMANNIQNELHNFFTYGFRTFIERWNACDILLGQKVELVLGVNGNKTETGIARGIDEQGNLVIELENGERKSYGYGEARLVKG